MRPLRLLLALALLIVALRPPEVEGADPAGVEAAEAPGGPAVWPEVGRRETSYLNGRFLILNMHGLLFHDDPEDVAENLAYARWLEAGVIRVFATDAGGSTDGDGRRLGDRIA